MKNTQTAAKVVPTPNAPVTKPPWYTFGRPTKYRPEFCQIVIDEMAKGYSLGAVAGTLFVARSQLNQWMANYPDFQDAVKMGKSLRLKKWETLAMANAEGTATGNATMTALGLKNAGAEDWTDRQEVVVVPPKGNLEALTDDELNQLIAIRRRLVSEETDVGASVH